MKIKWLIQDVGKTVMLQDNFGTLEKIKANYKGFGLIEGTSLISGLENILTDLDEHYIIRGGTKILHLLESYNHLNMLCDNLNDFQKEYAEIFLNKLKSGIFYNEKTFDQAYYNQLDLPLLNKDAFFIPIKDNKQTSFDKPYF